MSLIGDRNDVVFLCVVFSLCCLVFLCWVSRVNLIGDLHDVWSSDLVCPFVLDWCFLVCSPPCLRLGPVLGVFPKVASFVFSFFPVYVGVLFVLGVSVCSCRDPIGGRNDVLSFVLHMQ